MFIYNITLETDIWTAYLVSPWSLTITTNLPLEEVGISNL